MAVRPTHARWMLVLALLLLLAWSDACAQAALNVVATTPELASLAKEIGRDKVTVAALAKPTEDPHFVDAKPSFIAKLNKADVLIEGGAELETGWLTALLDGSRNPKIAASAPGRIVCAQGISLLDVPSNLDRSKGDLHAMGNPHFMMDPVNAEIVARHLAESLAILDPGAGDLYRKNLKLFLEPKPGIPPTPAHLAEVIRKMKASKATVIVVEPYQNRRTAETVAKETSAKVVGFAQYPGGVKGTEGGYIELMDYLVQSLASTFASTRMP